MENLTKKVDKKVLIIATILWMIGIGLSVVYCMGHVESVVGMKVFDLKFTYNFEYAQQFMSASSPNIIDFYRNVQIPIDYFLAIMLGIFPVICYSYMKKKISINNIFIFIALAISVLDATENTLLLFILGNDLNATLVNFAGIVTLFKNICMYATYVSLIYFLVRYKRAK